MVRLLSMKKELVASIKPKCLIVDDQQENLDDLSSLLSSENIQVFQASSGLDALELMMKHDFALALIDVEMPKMNGLELAEIMRSTDRTRSIPLIFVVSKEKEFHNVFHCYEAGAVDFLHTPLIPQIVLSKIRIFADLYIQKVQLKLKLAEIKETEAYLQKALRSRDEFLSLCSHELKTPLTSLKMQIQITNRLREKQGDEVAFSTETMDKFLQQADRSVEKIINLVNDMLDISRVTTGRLSLNFETVDYPRLIQDVLEKHKTFMELANCDVTFDPQENIKGFWDRQRIEQVFTNLLTNAAKYAPDRPVNIALMREGQMATLKVTDHGEGITKDDQSRIFERFERAVSSSSISGMGLGLFISKEIINLHNGTLSLESSIGIGTTFTVKLPLLP